VYFQHSTDLWAEHPTLVAGVVFATGMSCAGPVAARVDETVSRLTGVAGTRLATGSETELPEIQAWRRAFSRMGLKPTQYRCAAEALLRRYRKEQVLPRIHPLIDLCNAVSLAYAVPVAVFDAAKLSGGLEVRHAAGTERYLTFAGDTETPEPGEVVFADPAGRAHARRWTNRQSGYSAVRDTTTEALVVAEALHDSARADVAELLDVLTDELVRIWSVAPKSAVLSSTARRFELGA
jgi:DNA/RNA-binding domain of Phe-tRNA-synthetase-like protein